MKVFNLKCHSHSQQITNKRSNFDGKTGTESKSNNENYSGTQLTISKFLVIDRKKKIEFFF